VGGLARSGAGYTASMTDAAPLDANDAAEIDPPVALGHERRDAAPEVEGLVFAPDVARRSDLAVAIPPSTFPAGRDTLVDAAVTGRLDDELLTALRAIPDQEYHTVNEVWVAMGGPVEVSPGHHHTGEEAAEPAASDDIEPAASDDIEPAASDDIEPAASDDIEPAASDTTERPTDEVRPPPSPAEASEQASGVVVVVRRVLAAPPAALGFVLQRCGDTTSALARRLRGRR
jgi:hypothetical protein